MLEIPANIYSHTKHLWDEIQNKLHSDTDDKTPFAMLPVRLETRFMKVKRKWSAHIQTEATMAIWDSISITNDSFNTLSNHNFSKASEEIGVYSGISKKLEIIAESVNQDESPYSQGTKSTIKETVDFFKNGISEKRVKTKRNENLNSSEQRELIKNLKALEVKCDSIISITESKEQFEESQTTSLLNSKWNTPIYEVQEESELHQPLEFAEYRIVNELWVRIFPDDIHIHTHENPLTQDEINAGIEYWNLWWNSGGDIEIRKGAWKALCELYGPQRAAWIKDQMTPTNLPQEPIDDDSVITLSHSVFQGTTNFVQNVVSSNTFSASNFRSTTQSYLALANELTSEVEYASLSTESKNQLANLTKEFESEIETFTNMVNQASESRIEIDESRLMPVDFKELFRPLSERLLQLRDPNEESQFNSNEWIEGLQSDSQMIHEIIGQIEEGMVDLNSLKNASHENSIILGHIKKNQQVLMALEERGEKQDPAFEIMMQKVEGNPQMFMESMKTMYEDMSAVGNMISTGITNFKHWNIKMDMEAVHQLYELQEVFGQIKQNIQSLPVPEPWNPFDHLPAGNPIYPTPDTKEGSWTQAPKTYVMPDRFVAIGLNEKLLSTNPNSPNYGKNEYAFKQLEVGELVPPELHVGIDPSIDDDQIYAQTADGSLTVDDNMKWMVDFNEAVNKGMGIIMELENDFTPDQENNVFDKLVVMGVKVENNRFHKPNPENNYTNVNLKNHSKELMEELLVNHHYKEDGMGIVTVGTATNNTETGASGWQFDQMHFEDSFSVEALNNLYPIRTKHTDQYNGQRLADALGVDYGIFQHIQNADSTEVSDGFKFNKMLWHGTMGNYLQEMLSGLVSRSNYENAKAYYEDFVSARGVLPTLRVGSQPYGFLPTTSFTKWNFGVEIQDQFQKHPSKLNENTLHDSSGQPSKDYYDINKYFKSIKNNRFDAGFKSLLDLLQNRWYGLFHEPNLIKHVGGVSGTDDFMKALGLQASTAEVRLRFPYSIVNLFDSNNGTFPNGFGQTVGSDFFGMSQLGSEWMNLVRNGLFHENSMAFSQDNIVNHIQYLDSDFEIYKNTIDKYKLSEKQMINRDADNYIEWIRTADLRYIWDPTTAPDNPFPSKPPLFYLLLRQSYLMMHLDAFVDVSVQSGLLDPNMYHNLSNETNVISNLIGTSGGNIGTANDRFSKWAYLLENISDFSGSTGAFSHLDDYKTGLDQYMTNKNINFDTTNYTFAQHVQNYYSDFWKLRGGYHNRAKISDLDKVFRDVNTWSTAHIDRLFRENMDLGSYRLDAWMNGFVNERLEKVRKSYVNNQTKFSHLGQRQREKGIYIGAYGWLENVKPGGNRTPIDASDKLPSTLDIVNTTIFKDEDNLGFIHGPSVYHAMTAAILRSGYASNEDVSTSIDNPMAINLSSERVRMAKNLWEGIKNGQDLGALLGYQFERNLHELYPAEELDSYIYQLRRKYPIEDYKTNVDITLSDSIPAQNVVNGINLLADIREHMTTSATTLSLYDYVDDNLHSAAPSPTPMKFQINIPNITEVAILAREIDLMANAIDALGDLAVAEGVFQMSKGNFDRASTTIDTLLNNRNLPMPEIIDTPRTGYQVSNRFCVNMEMGVNGSGTVINPWTAVTLTEKANAAPHINQFIAKYLPDPANIKCLVSFVDTDNSTIEKEVSVLNLGWQPIDFYTTIQKTINNEGSEELIGRIATYSRQQLWYDTDTTPIPFNVELTILINERGGTWTMNDYAMMELLPIIESTSSVLSEIKPIKAQDFNQPQHTLISDSYGWDLTDLNARATNALTELNNLIISGSVDYVSLLTQAGTYNVSHTTPNSDDSGVLASQWTNALSGGVKEQLLIIYNQANNILTDPTSGALLANTDINDDTKWQKYLEIFQGIFGSDFTCLPILDLTTNGVDTTLDDYVDNIQSQIMSSVGTGFEQNVMNQWFYGLSRLRNKLGAFESLSDFDNTGSLEFSPIQFPFVEDLTAGTHDYWYGWEFPESYEPTGNKTSVIMSDHSILQTAITSTKMVGLMLDQWSETIPEKKEASGIAFHYDQPNTKPPQNVLLAVTPSFTGNWDGNDLLFTLLDTLKMSKVRLVEPEHLQTDPFLGKYLPTTYSLIKLKLSDYNLSMDYVAASSATSIS